MPARRIPRPWSVGDAGDAVGALSAALARYAADPTAEVEVLSALATARVLVPVVAMAADGLRATEMALATLVGEDGRRALPVFTSVETLGRWDAAARPLPVACSRAAAAARDEGASLLVVDVAGPVPYVVVGPALRVLAAGGPLVPMYADRDVALALAAALAPEPLVRSAYLLPSPGVDARLGLVLEPADAADLTAFAQRLADRLAALPPVRRAVVRGFDVALLTAVPPDVAPCYSR